MATAMRHRGPDDEGLWLSDDGRVGLVNRRLAIVDCSPNGHMPMRNHDGTACITHNGEVYNAAELRRELTALGHRFRSTGDTEAILRGYEAWGPDVVHRLRGMFAFAIYDGRQRRLFLARDRLGIKPLYYSVTPEAFVFASELGALQVSGLVGRTVSPAGLVGYLLLGSVPGPLTIYNGIHALEPGCTLSLDIAGPAAAPKPHRYWTFPTDVVAPPSSAAAVGEVRSLLEDAVRCHLVSDVPLGAFLSGGLDSSAVVTLMRAVTGGPIRTCSMVFEEAGYSETVYARAVASAVGTEHTERIVTGGEVAGALDRILRTMDQPTVDGVNTYFVAETARQAGLTVALSGLGGDELFGGYPNTFAGVPGLLRALRVAQSVPAAAPVARAGLRWLGGPGRWAKVADALERPATPASAYLACRGLFPPAEVRMLVGPELWEAAAVGDPAGRIVSEMDVNGHGADWFSWVSRAELSGYTLHQLLRDTDVMSMAHSLEVRVPLLDHRLVEAVLRLPGSVKREGGRPKALLVRAVGDLLPPTVRARRPKQGFVFPFERWLRGELRGVCLEWQRETGGLLRPDVVAQVWRAYDAGRLHWSRPWALAALGGWRDATAARVS
jgi:asparagine synthase (glutamine-hydrolysing)